MAFLFGIFWSFLDVVVFMLSWIFGKKPTFLYQTKIQKNLIVTKEEYLKCFLNVAMNHIFILFPLFTFGSFIFLKLGWHGGPLPSFSIIFRDFLVCIFAEEFGFYYSHRLLHKGFLWDYVHKIHHQFRAPVGMASEYAHPVEFILSNLLPVILGPSLVGSHFAVAFAWIFTAISTTINGHSGFRIPFGFFGESQKHDYHHSHYIGNYGAIGLLDWLHGTDKGFKKYVQEKNDLSKKDKTDSNVSTSKKMVNSLSL